MNPKITLYKRVEFALKHKGHSIITKTIWSLILLLGVTLSSCKKDTYTGEVVGLCPVIVSTDPMDKAVDVVTDKTISATFNTSMNPATINNSTFTIMQGVNVINGTVAPTTDGAVFTFKPTTNLSPFTTYKGKIAKGVKDTLRTAMVDDYTWTFTTLPRITLSANPVNGGTLLGAGDFAQGSTVTVSATAGSGFVFTNWTENGVIVSKSVSYQFKMNGNRNLVANFIPIPVGNSSVTLSSNPSAGGNLNGGGAYPTGSIVTVLAAANPGYTFSNWTENNVVVSTSSSYQFTLNSNRTLVANFKVVPASQFALILSSNPPAGGMTDGEGSYTAGTSVTAIATVNTGYTFNNWTENGVIVSTSANYTFPLNGNRSLVANFSVKTFTLNVVAVNGTVSKSPSQATYNYNTDVILTATPAVGYQFSSWSGDLTGTANPKTITMNANKNVTANFTAIPSSTGIGPKLPGLGLAGNFAILTKSGISTTGVTSITGDIGVSPAAASSITGFGLIMDTNGQSSHTPIVVGSVYASDYAAPTPANMTTAVSNMETAFTNSNGLTTPAPVVNLGAGNISGLTVPPGLYKFSTGVLITNAGVTLTGGANDTWVFQISQDLTVNSNAIIHLLGGAQAKNIYWVVTGKATLDTDTDFSGVILSKTLISLNARSKVTGRLLAQTAVTLNTATVTEPQ
ncbi:MAG: DUF3494 domain-containing protein [Sphingobacteriales bacterium]|nr:DUF3494 domain-containing protein [Sphingobacteriales bacterium]